MRRGFWKATGLGLVTATAALSGILGAQAAYASGTSAYTNGCYSQWWSTAFNSQCPKATQTGNYWSSGTCSAQGTGYGPARAIAKGSSVGWFSPAECTFSVTRSWVSFSGG